MTDANITERQRKWFASVRANLEARTGRTLEDWVEVARTCPETKHRARLKWFKETHGLMQNSASQVLDIAFPSAMKWDEPATLRDALWNDPTQAAILEAVERIALALPEVIAGQRKGYSAWSRKVQFAALRPAKGGTAVLGLAVPPDASPRLRPVRNEGWSERLKATAVLAAPQEADARIEALIRRAWDGA